MKYFIIAGERSGDLHGSNLITAIKKADSEAQIQGWGGDYMTTAGATILKHYKDLAFMGFFEVIQNLSKILGFFRLCKNQIEEFQPDAIVLIDYSGFNMRIAKWAKPQGYKLFYYISPKVWAWNQRRALKLKQTIDRLFVIFPFEVDFFKNYDYEVEFVGNPLFDAIAAFRPNPDFLNENNLGEKKIIALLPGSRKQEVEQMLKLMVATKKQFPDYQYVIAGVGNLSKEFYERFLTDDIRLVFDQAYDLLSHSEAAMVTSGTATLETALFGVPQVVCYKMSLITYSIASMVVKIEYISLVNLIAQKEVVKELLQGELTTENIAKEIKKVLNNSIERKKQIADYQKVREILGSTGASAKTGKRIVEILNNSNLVNN
ncbi:lipid-A-disaccharide synthase [Emticicia sp. BO119]|uniref:lipid-A-disaccharide synthase n=1 Tax=Emticicia sp. BO119 TaxID=2757768 RepID=UPI0015F0B2F9|nr:lipid-A-disaccharide synthase [Emticicia sp. BO119]MBA4850153.1 lipid-A-disaccharide synthase [Emticicia sp. BO119]